MSTHIESARRLLLPLGLATLLAAPLQAQTGTTTGAVTTPVTAAVGNDTIARGTHTDDNDGFPWGLLGLLGLAGLLRRPAPVVREPVVRETTVRPGDPNYRA